MRRRRGPRRVVPVAVPMGSTPCRRRYSVRRPTAQGVGGLSGKAGRVLILAIGRRWGKALPGPRQGERVATVRGPDSDADSWGAKQTEADPRAPLPWPWRPLAVPGEAMPSSRREMTTARSRSSNTPDSSFSQRLSLERAGGHFVGATKLTPSGRRSFVDPHRGHDWAADLPNSERFSRQAFT
jgi:hypothetical protein